MSSEPVLTIRGLNVDYGTGDDAVHALRDIDLTLHRGEVLGLAGESGSGKSTLAYAVTRLLSPPGVITGGEVHYHQRDGEALDLLTLSAPELRAFRWQELSIVFQGAMNSLNPVHTVHSQLTDVLQAHRPEMNRAERTVRAKELLALVGISADRLPSYPHQLSGGMRQRVMIAMALACDPGLIIADEPTTALDVMIQAQILRLIEQLVSEQGLGLIMISHDLAVLSDTCDRLAVMYAGRVVEEGPASEVYENARHPYGRALSGAFPRIGDPASRFAPRGLPGDPPDPSALPGGCTFHPRCPVALDSCTTQDQELRDAGAGRRAACVLVEPGAVAVAARPDAEEARSTP